MLDAKFIREHSKDVRESMKKRGLDSGIVDEWLKLDEKLKELKEKPEAVLKLRPEEREQIEEDVYDIIGDEIDRDKPVILDFESIEVLKPGQYQLDLVKLFHEKEPLVYKLEDGKYFVDVIETFQRLRDKDKEKKRK